MWLDTAARRRWIRLMEFSRIVALRHALTAVLVLALTMAGLGRGFADAPHRAMSSVTIAGLVVPICHAGPMDDSGPSTPDAPVPHDCCDQCALLAPVILPAPPSLIRPLPVAAAPQRHAAVPASPHLVRLRLPRQSQGPPTA